MEALAVSGALLAPRCWSPSARGPVETRFSSRGRGPAWSSFDFVHAWACREAGIPLIHPTRSVPSGGNPRPILALCGHASAQGARRRRGAAPDPVTAEARSPARARSQRGPARSDRGRREQGRRVPSPSSAGAIGRHFPADENGAWAGFHPRDSRHAIALLESERVAGVDHFACPRPEIGGSSTTTASLAHLGRSTGSSPTSPARAGSGRSRRRHEDRSRRSARSEAGNGGEAWVRLSYLLGLGRLGAEVSFIEQVEAPAPAAIAWFESVTAAFAIRGEPGRRLRSVCSPARTERCRSAAQHQRQRALENGAAGFGGQRSSTSTPGSRSSGTSGGSSGSPGTTCTSRSDRTSAEAVVRYPHAGSPGVTPGRRSCSTSGRSPSGGFRPVHHRLHVALAVRADRAVRAEAPSSGVTFLHRPSEAGLVFEAALRIDPRTRPTTTRSTRQGWRLVDRRGVAAEPDGFRDYVQGSGAEFSVAQGIYVETRSGWFSDRSTRYLASGRPVLVQETGFSQHVPVGEGLLAFTTPDEAAAAARGDRRRLRPACSGGASGRRRVFRLGQGARRAARTGVCEDPRRRAWSRPIRTRAGRPGRCSSTCSASSGSVTRWCRLVEPARAARRGVLPTFAGFGLARCPLLGGSPGRNTRGPVRVPHRTS